MSQQDVRDYEGGARPTPDLAEWPVGLGAPAVDASGRPITAASRDRVVDLAAGERPVIYGTQTAFWIMNDVGNEHKSTGSAPLGIEVAATAFVVASETLALHQSSFLRYTITNRNTAAIEDARVTVFADVDLGDGGGRLRGLGHDALAWPTSTTPTKWTILSTGTARRRRPSGSMCSGARRLSRPG